MNDLSLNPITASSYTSYHAITSSSNGTIGMVISVQEGGPTNPCGVTKIAKLYPLGTNCSSASAISAATTTANGATLYNPEWTGLSPNTSYILEIVFTIPSGCALIDHCESFYYPSSPPSTTCGSCSNANCPITHVPTFADRFNGYYPNGNCNSMGNISNTTYITYHTITAGPVGEIGLVQQLNIFPNPSSGIINIQFTNNTNTTIKITNILGENVFGKMDKAMFINFLKSGIGYGYHYVHAKKPSEIHHFAMTKAFMNKLAQPRSAIAYYGGKTSAGKRVDIDIDTPNIMLKINIRNKQGGVYPSHIMCDYIFKSYK